MRYKILHSGSIIDEVPGKQTLYTRWENRSKGLFDCCAGFVISMKFDEINEGHLFNAEDAHGVALSDSEEIRKKRWEMIVRAQNQAKKEINQDFPFDLKK